MNENFLGELKVLQRLNKYEFGVELRVMRSGPNRNRWDYQNIEEHYLTFLGQPILCAFPKGQIGDGHNSKEATDPDTGEKYFSFLGDTYEKIVGTLSSDPADFRLEDDEEGRTWIIAKGKLFTFYARELVENIIKVGVMEVSAETAVYESYQDGDIEVFTSWEGLGVTCLGAGVAPAIPGARIEELAAIKEEFNDLCLRAASYISEEPEEPEEEQEEEEPEVPVFENENENKPQNNSQKGESRVLKSFSKKQVAELAPKFEGYNVLGAGHDENGIYVALMSADGATYSYTMGDKNETIAPEKIIRVDSLVSFDFGEDAKLDVYACELTDNLSASLIAANNKISGLESDLADANATIQTMTENEKQRRISAAKNAAKAALNEFNKNRTELVDDDVLTAVNAAIDNGDFTDCVTEAGEWSGEARVRKEVLAACAEKVIEIDKAAAEKAKANNAYIWDNINSNEGAKDGISALLAKAHINQ